MAGQNVINNADEWLIIQAALGDILFFSFAA